MASKEKRIRRKERKQLTFRGVWNRARAAAKRTFPKNLTMWRPRMGKKKEGGKLGTGRKMWVSGAVLRRERECAPTENERKRKKRKE